MILEEGPERVLEKRVEAMRWIKRRARELESEEKKLHDAMPEWRAKVVKGKKFLLFKELVDLVGHEDKDLFRDLVSGMRITGNAEPTQLFVVDFKPAQLEDKDPVASCKVFSSGSSEEDPDAHEPKACEQVDIAEEVWKTTMKEVEKGWLKGPLTAEQVASRVGPVWTPSSR